MFNGRPQCKACVARFEAALEQEASKSDQEGQTSSEEACKARSEAPLELGAKNVRCARRVEDESSCKSTATLLDTDGFKTLQPFGMDQATLLSFERLAGPKTRKGDPGKS